MRASSSVKVIFMISPLNIFGGPGDTHQLGVPLGLPHVSPHSTPSCASHKGSSNDGSYTASVGISYRVSVIRLFSLSILVLLGLLCYELCQVFIPVKVLNMVLQCIHSAVSCLSWYHGLLKIKFPKYPWGSPFPVRGGDQGGKGSMFGVRGSRAEIALPEVPRAHSYYNEQFHQ